MIWVGFYCLFFLGVIPISDPVYFVKMMEVIQLVCFPVLIFIWYMICYASWF